MHWHLQQQQQHTGDVLKRGGLIFYILVAVVSCFIDNFKKKNSSFLRISWFERSKCVLTVAKKCYS